MGSAVFIAIGTSIFNGDIVAKLKNFGIDDPTSLIHNFDFNKLDPELLARLRRLLSGAYNQQAWLLCACGVAQVLVVLLFWKKKAQIRVSDI